LMAPLLDKVIRASGGHWRVGWQIIAGGAVLAGLLVVLFVKESPEDVGQEVDGIPKEESAAESSASGAAQRITQYEWTPAQAYRTRAYWMVVIGGLTAQFPFFFFTAHWILHLQAAGISSSDAAFALGLFTISGIGGRLIGGWLMDTISARYAFMMGLSCCLLGSIAALRVGPASLLMTDAAAVLYGLSIGWAFTCMTTCLAHFYGPMAFPKLAGMALLLTSGGASPAGIVGGWIFDIYGSYRPAFELNFVITVIGIVAIAFATLPRPRDARETMAQVA
jgi:sugar phosphate permease